MKKLFYICITLATVLFSCSKDDDNTPQAEEDATVEICDPDGYEKGHAYVDLGLTTKQKWATANVGAANATDNGSYFKWGGVNAITSIDDEAAEVKLESTEDSLTMTLAAENDAATVNMGGKWRMPTMTDMQKLTQQCYLKWTNNYHGTGAKGLVVYKAKDSNDRGKASLPNGPDKPKGTYTLADKHIFIPAAGCYFNEKIFSESTYFANCALYSSTFSVSRDCAWVMWYFEEKNENTKFRGIVPVGTNMQAACVRGVLD